MTIDVPDLDVLDTEAALLALAPEWAALHAATPDATPFQSPGWLLPWWRHFGTGMPRVAVARQAGVLSGVLPMYVLDEPGVRKLLPIGAGTTDYLDALGGPAEALLRAVLARTREDRVDWCDLIEVPPGSALRDAAPPGWDAEWGASSPCPVRMLADPVPPGTLRKLRMNRNRAGRQGGWTIEDATPTTVAPLLDDLIGLHQARWLAQGEPGALASPPVLAFHREAAPALLQAGLLRLQALRIGGAVAASCYALLAGRDRILFYLSGFDEAHAFVSPGTLLLAEMLERAAQEGRREAHFLRGREAYKYAWGGVDRLNSACRFRPA